MKKPQDITAFHWKFHVSSEYSVSIFIEGRDPEPITPYQLMNACIDFRKNAVQWYEECERVSKQHEETKSALELLGKENLRLEAENVRLREVLNIRNIPLKAVYGTCQNDVSEFKTALNENQKRIADDRFNRHDKHCGYFHPKMNATIEPGPTMVELPPVPGKGLRCTLSHDIHLDEYPNEFGERDFGRYHFARQGTTFVIAEVKRRWFFGEIKSLILHVVENSSVIVEVHPSSLATIERR